MPPTQDVPVESSPTTPQPSSEQPLLSPSEMTSEQRQEWRKTGEIPQPKPEDPAPSKPAAGETPGETKAAPASQPVKPQEPNKRNAESRIRELNAENKRLRDQLAAHSALPPKPADKPASPPAPAAKPDEDPRPSDKVNPKTGKPWKDWQEFKAADDDWLIREAERRFEKNASARQAKADQERRLAEFNKTWKERCDAEVAADPEFAAKAFDPTLPVNQAAQIYILQQPLGAKILGYLANHREEAQKIAALDPISTVKALVAIEAGFAKPDTTPAPPAVPRTRAPRPAADLGARNSAPADEEMAAAARGDFRSYKRLADKNSRR